MNTYLLTPDPGLRRLAGGRVLLGGSPYRVLRLTAAGARLADGWLAGSPVADRPAHRRLAARLVRAGLAHPHPAGGRLTPADVTVVVPVRDHARALGELLPAIGPVGRVVVVDDGSAVPVAGAAVRHAAARGPAAARNSGWRLASTELVCFLDADVRPQPGWLEPLLRQFEDPGVRAAAPRVRSAPGPSVRERYEEHRSPLDLGPLPSAVRPGTRVPYVPTAALVVRTRALEEHAGFDEEMRFGEDVDLVWRLAEDGEVRYVPDAVVHHAPRRTWRAWARQRFGYGTSAAPLFERHGPAVAPVRMSPWSALSWAAVAAGRPLAGLAVAAGTAALLPRKLSRSGVPARVSLSLALRGHAGAGGLLAEAAGRVWWPVLAAHPRGRMLLAASCARHLARWYRVRPDLDPVRWTALSAADDLAYGAGVWWGALRGRTTGPLRPDLAAHGGARRTGAGGSADEGTGTPV
ncbi:mycofactocin biosynthesis glycosyltransferase MftF [Streptomyces sp. NPDC002181]|uniref:mycofactocin biosynthesis glycosyltransferase MftF n=1 Tax=Streptomyces sp. NPDC002181 TaxID=3364635 RepID=UPI0036A02465